MKFFWNKEKNERLKAERNICFEDVVQAISEGHLLDERLHPNQEIYQHQRIFIVFVQNYTYMIPYVVDVTGKIFLKTIIPSRKFHKEFLF